MAEECELGAEERVVERQARLLDVDEPPPPARMEAVRAAAWLAGWHRAIVRLGMVEWEGREDLAEAYAEGYEAGRVLVEAGGERRTGEAGRLRSQGTATAGAMNGAPTRERHVRRWWIDEREDRDE